MIDIELLGFVHHWGLDVNSITVIGEAFNCGRGSKLTVDIEV